MTKELDKQWEHWKGNGKGVFHFFSDKKVQFAYQPSPPFSLPYALPSYRPHDIKMCESKLGTGRTLFSLSRMISQNSNIGLPLDCSSRDTDLTKSDHPLARLLVVSSSKVCLRSKLRVVPDPNRLFSAAFPKKCISSVRIKVTYCCYFWIRRPDKVYWSAKGWKHGHK